MRVTRFIPALVSSAAALGAIVMGTPAWAASTSGLPSAILSSPSFNSVGEAGYSTAAGLAGWRFRYISGHVTVTDKMMQLDTAGGQVGGTGLQLCDPNTGNAAQVGITWNPSVNAFEAVYRIGHLSAQAPAIDPCTSGGMLSTMNTVQQGTLNVGSISVGDNMSFALYYNFRHQTLDIAACDNTNGSNFCPHQFEWVGHQRYFEAAAGVQNVNELHLSYPPDVNVANFSFIHITGWLHHHLARGNFRHGPWNTQQVISTTNGAGNGTVNVTPNNSLNRWGGGFSVFMGNVVNP